MFLFWINTTLDLGPNFIGAFAERHEGTVPVFVRGSDTLFQASLFLIGGNPSREILGILNERQD
jgi:hypothetical protein